MVELNSIFDFLAQRRIALIGLSQNPKHFSRALFRELIDRKYQICPVNPNSDNIDGFPCYKNISEVMRTDYGQFPVGGALIMTSHEKYPELVEQCLQTGIKRIWLYGMGGNKNKYPELERICREQNVTLIADLCPFMFLPRTGFIHRLHGGILKLFGKYPQ